MSTKYIRRVLFRTMLAESLRGSETFKYTYSNGEWASNKLHFLNADELLFEQPIVVGDRHLFIFDGYISKILFENVTKIIGKIKE